MLDRFDVSISATSEQNPLADARLSLADFLRLDEPLACNGSKISDEAKQSLQPLTTVIPNLTVSREIIGILTDRFTSHLQYLSNIREIRIDLDFLSRPAACIIVSFLINIGFFKEIDLVYTEYSYKVDSVYLDEKLKNEEFWAEVYDYKSKLVVVPNLPGRYDASLPKSVFICGGLDFGRVIHLAAMWEPREIILTRPGSMESAGDKALIWNDDSLVTNVISIDRMNIGNLVAELNIWIGGIDKEILQPLVICGGWKLQAVVACLWAASNERAPTFVCAPDFISKNVERVAIAKWLIKIRDKSIWA